ncbi:MAG TPA: gliding motility-associated C-terminal domain-containing protein, partial [Puia sp.]
SAAGGTVEYLQDVWTKNWTEVTYDLSPYRGQQVTLTFEADNCVPGGHFSYAYLAIRNSCAGLEISGDSVVCNNSIITYSVPTLAGASYDWIVPNSWQVISGVNDNILQVKSSSAGGVISVREKNSCADLTDTIQINTLPSPVGGSVNGSNTVCEGDNSTVLNLTNYSGNIQNWQYSSDGNTWTNISNTTAVFNADNLQQSTLFRVVVAKGNVCPADTSIPAAVTVDKKSIGGQLSPLNATLCAGQSAGEILTLTNNNGSVLEWQYSTDGTNWTDFAPGNNSPFNTIKDITASTQYRTIVKNGICPADTSAVAGIQFDPVAFPQASAGPPDTTICYGTPATLNASIEIGTSYAWTPGSSDYTGIGSIPFNNVHSFIPDQSGYFVLHVVNDGCPNPFLDTLHVEVLAPVIVNAGRDTSVIAGQPLHFNATSSDPGPDNFSWVPATELSDPLIPDPVATYTLNDNVISYLVKAVTPFGCEGTATVKVKVFKTKPDIFVPNAFTPGLSMNAVFRPIPVGISSLEYFRIYNRLGELVYNTSSIGSGWDGNLNGSAQNAGGYVWMVKGTDYLGQVITKKGVMVLIR